MPSIFALNDPNKNFFTHIGEENLKFISSQLNQKDKLNLAKCSTLIYRQIIPKLYESIIIVISYNGKNISQQTKVPFVYSNDVSIISSRLALKKFFKTVNKNILDYNKRIKFSLLIKLFHVYFSMVPKNHKFIDLNSNDTFISLENFEDTFIDCYEYSHESNRKLNSIPNIIVINLLKLTSNLSFCQDISYPSSIYTKLYHNTQCYDFIKRKKVVRGIDSNISTYYRQWREGEFLLDLKKIGSGLKFTFLHLTTLRLSFADPFNAKKILELCNSDILRTLTLDHLNCAYTCRDSVCSSSRNLNNEQMNRKFELYEQFFHSSKITKIFKNLKNLQIITHNGYNRILFRQFLYCIFKHVVRYKVGEFGPGKLKLKSFQIRESTTDFSIVNQVENTFSSNPYVKRMAFDNHHSSTLTILTDLLKISQSNVSIFDILDFNYLQNFTIFARCLPNMMYRKRYEYEIVNKFKRKMMKQTSKLKNNICIRIKVDCYDKGLMIPRDVVYDDVDTDDEEVRLSSEVNDSNGIKMKQIIQSVVTRN
ncbi:hypothetical protein BN7_4733 [Wickerhamomyces ciferrii]|uniref:F-box domain-containing protein n=1 Tax=Wickerhamomyces ciferrii (strain ATCC 14091 / BCRC 22168 / CBS 111 / JCM 3599 / NBRC 0793 / NRRL Y-1031 F-60-10) TaxID=1206466 RepID=K0KUP7_WICCF|nr:uncharacterized protein BN7_4733 [Wickerhamomyces ciferrii]CCH45154.1 hypothetical protein BN7_4733 [Wickerhamomyces ciferrii]